MSDQRERVQTQFDYFGATSEFVLKQIKNLTAGRTPTVISQFDYTCEDFQDPDEE